MGLCNVRGAETPEALHDGVVVLNVPAAHLGGDVAGVDLGLLVKGPRGEGRARLTDPLDEQALRYRETMCKSILYVIIRVIEITQISIF